MGSNPIGVTELMLFSIQLNFVWYGLGKRKKSLLEKQKFQQSTNVWLANLRLILMRSISSLVAG